MNSTKGFTLIELLIVVAIIAILAAIAVPNFLEAQMRAKVSRAKTDMRSVSLALESYRTDQNAYPVCYTVFNGVSGIDNPNMVMMKVSGTGNLVTFDGYWPNMATTPVSYITTLPRDPFPTKMWGGVAVQPFPVNNAGAVRNYYFWVWPSGRNVISGLSPVNSDIFYMVVSPGPDQQMDLGMEWATGGMFANCIYDPSNGTVSGGNITRFGP
jgi:prepilin-type N-terminal cleavage/methylation domain-containing protein